LFFLGIAKGAKAMRGFRDRDYLETVDGYFFCVLDSIHPEDRVIAYLKYIPDPRGKWGRGHKRLRRALPNYTMHDLLGTFKFLKANNPEYLFFSHVMNIEISAVPLDKILIHFKPEKKLLYFTRREDLDALQKKTVELASLISEESGVPLRFFGVTGSILIDAHQNFSDIDLVIYGRRNSISVKETLKQIYESHAFPIRRFNAKESREWCLNKARLYPLTYNEAAKILERRWNRGVYEETFFSIHPVKTEDEIDENYGDRIFKPKGMVKIEAIVSDSSESDFLPAIYKVKDVRVLEGEKVSDINEVVSYEGLYGGLAKEGERILAYGKMEHVTDRRSGKIYHRVLIGSREAEGRDYIKPLT